MLGKHIKINDMKSCETLLKYCFWDNFVSRKKLNKMTTKTGDKVKDDLNKMELLLLAGKICRKVNKKERKITPYHFLALLEGSNKLTWRKRRRLERMVMVYCMQVYDKKKCKKCGDKKIRIKTEKKYMKTIGKKVMMGYGWKVKILKCGCGEYLKVSRHGMWKENTCTIKL